MIYFLIYFYELKKIIIKYFFILYLFIYIKYLLSESKKYLKNDVKIYKKIDKI
jgi:hypothetical protein